MYENVINFKFFTPFVRERVRYMVKNTKKKPWYLHNVAIFKYPV